MTQGFATMPEVLRRLLSPLRKPLSTLRQVARCIRPRRHWRLIELDMEPAANIVEPSLTGGTLMNRLSSNRVAALFAGTVLGLAFAGAAPAAAQSIASDMDFRGVNTLRVAASPMTVESLDCGIESASLVRELQHQFESEGLRPAATDTSLGVVTVLSARDGDRGLCNSTLMLGAYKKASFFDKDVGWIRSGYVVMWQSAVLVTSPSESHPTEVRDALARLGDALLGDWRAANRPAAASTTPAPGQ